MEEKILYVLSDRSFGDNDAIAIGDDTQLAYFQELCSSDPTRFGYESFTLNEVPKFRKITNVKVVYIHSVFEQNIDAKVIVLRKYVEADETIEHLNEFTYPYRPDFDGVYHDPMVGRATFDANMPIEECIKIVEAGIIKQLKEHINGNTPEERREKASRHFDDYYIRQSITQPSTFTYSWNYTEDDPKLKLIALESK